MTIQQIKSAIDSGKNVYWSNTAYKVIKDSENQYLIQHMFGGCIGLTNLKGDKLNGLEAEFFEM